MVYSTEEAYKEIMKAPIILEYFGNFIALFLSQPEQMKSSPPFMELHSVSDTCSNRAITNEEDHLPS